MLLIVGTVRIPPGSIDTARPAMKRMIAATRAEDGCLDYFYAEDVADPGRIHVIELWRDRDALDRHFGAAHLSEWRDEWPRLGITDRDLRLYEVGEAVAV